jgi:pimeloyl-ACP methyl ester carboxylesterase
MVDDAVWGLRGGRQVTAATERKLSLPDGRIFVREVGAGPTVLLINGLGAHTGMWEPLERTLAGFRIVEFDLPGTGRSDVPWKPVSVPRLARLTASVMDEVGAGSAHVLGYSMGGIVAQQLCADMPERVKRLILVASSPGVGGLQGDFKAMLSIATPARYLSRRAYGLTIGSLAGGRARYDPDWVDQHGALRLRYAPSWRGYFGQMLSLMTWSGLPLLSRIEHPVLVVAGDDDPLTPVANGMLLASMLPNGRLLVCAGEGHLMVMDTDSAAQPAIREFLSVERLDQAKVWRRAARITPEELETALRTGPIQLPPWSIINSAARRRWLTTQHVVRPSPTDEPALRLVGERAPRSQ